METDLLHTEQDFEEWMEENGFDPSWRRAALEKFAIVKNYTMEELEDWE
jgi:hypothetical protein